MVQMETEASNQNKKSDAVSRTRKIVDEALDELGEALKQGKSETLIRFLSMLAKFHRYSFSNVMLIVAQRPDASQVAGFQTWKSLCRFVKKGEKGILIIAPMFIPKHDDDSEADEAVETIVRFRAVYVFDVSQTEGAPLPEAVRVVGDPSGYLDRLKAFIAERGIRLTYEDGLGSADGVSRGGQIAIRPGLATADEFAVMVHELAHELLHRDDSRPANKTVRETEAEAVAFVVCQSIGLDTGTAASDYIQLYDGKVETLAHSLDRVQRVAAEIIMTISDGEEPSYSV